MLHGVRGVRLRLWDLSVEFVEVSFFLFYCSALLTLSPCLERNSAHGVWSWMAKSHTAAAGVRRVTNEYPRSTVCRATRGPRIACAAE